MSELFVSKNILIDDVESVLEGIRNETSKGINSIETIVRFIREEKNTQFYFDSKMNCTMEPDKNTEYLWLDTGFTKNDHPVFISLIMSQGMFIGHFYGTMEKLSHAFRKKVTSGMLKVFRSKYEKKIKNREHQHIENEITYLVTKCNQKGKSVISCDDEAISGTMAMKIAALGVDFSCNNPEEASAPVQEETKKIAPVIPIEKYTRNDFEEEITIGLLLDKIDEMQAYVDDLLGKIDELSSKDESQSQDIEILKEKNVEYKRAMVQMRTFIEEEQESALERQHSEHVLEENHLLLTGKKILVLGDCRIEDQLMKGIAKRYGFQNADLEFQTDYSKVVNYAGRIKNNGRYYAVIFGACPHKVQGLDAASSIIEKCRQDEDMPFAVDARTKAGELKASKQSFVNAMLAISEQLKDQVAC